MFLWCYWEAQLSHSNNSSQHNVCSPSSRQVLLLSQVIIYIVKYLMDMLDVGLKFKPDQSKRFENYGDANFSGNLEGDTAEFDLNMAKSCSRWITFFDRCPLIWNSKLQTKNALLTTEAEYISYNHCAISYQSWICWRR